MINARKQKFNPILLDIAATLPLQHVLDLRFLPIHKPHQVFEGSGSRRAVRGRRLDLLHVRLLTRGSESTVLRDNTTEEDGEREETRDPRDEEKTPETVERERLLVIRDANRRTLGGR